MKKLTLNLDRTNFMKFVTNNKPITDMNKLSYYDQSVQEAKTTNLVDLQTDNQLHWKSERDQIIPKLISSCFAMRSV